MAFAAARMIKEKEARQNQGGNHSAKKTTDIIHSHSRSTNLKVNIDLYISVKDLIPIPSKII